jgi:hypothetical protein
MESIVYKTKSSKPISIRLPMDIYNFLAQKAIDDNEINEKGKPSVGGYVVEKCQECFQAGWDVPREENPEGKNMITKAEVINDMGWVNVESQRYRALCEIIEAKSHNGIKYYMKEVDKLLAKRKQLENV